MVSILVSILWSFPIKIGLPPFVCILDGIFHGFFHDTPHGYDVSATALLPAPVEVLPKRLDEARPEVAAKRADGDLYVYIYIYIHIYPGIVH